MSLFNAQFLSNLIPALLPKFVVALFYQTKGETAYHATLYWPSLNSWCKFKAIAQP